MSLPVVAITNESTVVAELDVQRAIPALQRQVSLDFKAYWQIDATLEWLPKAEPLPAGWWQIVVLDDPDQANALGYHELSANGTPLGKIFARLDQQSGSAWTVTLSHELLEMLGDPWINLGAQGVDGRIYALEVCDAVEADQLGYVIDRDVNGNCSTPTLVSDFVTPSWFEPTIADRYDFKERLAKPMELAQGGYISVFQNGAWTQIQSMRYVGDHTKWQGALVGSRRLRRGQQGSWKRSKRRETA